MNKLLTILIYFLIVVVGVLVVSYYQGQTPLQKAMGIYNDIFNISNRTFPGTNVGVNGKYQGPVPEGYDEDYYRQTGITKPLEDSK